MFIRPRFVGLDLVDRLLETTLGDHGNGQPLDAIGGLDAIAIVPMPLHILRTVIDHVFIAPPDQVEKALPGNVTGLNDANTHVKPLGRVDRRRAPKAKRKAELL